MGKVIYFNNPNQTTDLCSGNTYSAFLDYAFSQADYFMLVYVNYYGKGFTKIMKEYKTLLGRFQIKTRTNPSWPGTPSTYTPNSQYRIIFYKTSEAAKAILRGVNRISDWSSPTHPQDLAFFKGNQCWFYSVGHENISAFMRATEQDMDFLERNNLGCRYDALEMNNFYRQFDEDLEG